MLEELKVTLNKIKEAYNLSQKNLFDVQKQIKENKERVAALNIDTINIEWQYNVLKSPEKRRKMVFKKHNLFAKIVSLIFMSFISVFSVIFMLSLLATEVGFSLIIMKIFAVVLAFFLPIVDIYMAKECLVAYRKVTDDLIETDEIVKKCSLDEVSSLLKKQIQDRENILNEQKKLRDLEYTLTCDIDSYANSYNTISLKLANSNDVLEPITKQKEQKLTREK